MFDLNHSGVCTEKPGGAAMSITFDTEYRFDPVTNSMKLEETLINKDCGGKFGFSVVLQDEDRQQKVKFQMDKNGNLERVEK